MGRKFVLYGYSRSKEGVGLILAQKASNGVLGGGKDRYLIQFIRGYTGDCTG